MSATSLKLRNDLKRRIAKLAAYSGQTTHAFMVDALAREAERSELHQRFAAEAADSEREALDSGMAHSLNAAFDYLAGRIAGKNPRRPRARPWRASEVQATSPPDRRVSVRRSVGVGDADLTER